MPDLVGRYTHGRHDFDPILHRYTLGKHGVSGVVVFDATLVLAPMDRTGILSVNRARGLVLAPPNRTLLLEGQGGEPTLAPQDHTGEQEGFLS